LALRDVFYRERAWDGSETQNIFCSLAYPAPYKGLHDAIRALALLTPTVPKARLRVAGAIQGGGFRRDGYISWVNRLAKKLGVSGQIDWLGPLPATGIVRELQACSVMLMPSHCESYCVAFAEAMYLGVPSLSACTGGTSWLARDEESALFYQPGDTAMCAMQLKRLLTDAHLACRLSKNARGIAVDRNDPKKILRRQLDIYQTVLSENA
jgi:D-inositol-3-phosphate glycosyltransferase